jgi:purine-binding chemotaxis protein CheW
VVIILNVARRVIGVVVDSVSDVISLTQSQIRPAPDFSGTFDTRYILGLASQDSRMMIVTDIERLMTSADMELIDSATE